MGPRVAETTEHQPPPAPQTLVGEAPALSFRHLSKSFAGTRALDDVGLDIAPGEVHGLLGENGSGKSTLIKVLAGFHSPESGELDIHGERISLPLAPGAFREFGIDFVHQDLGLIPSLTVAENLRIGPAIARPHRRWFVSWRDERRRAREIFARFGLPLDPAAQVRELRPVERALLAIVRAIEGMGGTREGSMGGILVLDEPTVFLPNADAERLFSLVRQLTESRASVLFVSHDLDEVLRVTDRITVLRDGRNAGTVTTPETNDRELIRLITGHDLDQAVHQRAAGVEQTRQVVASIDSARGGLVEDVSLEVLEGEVLGLTGLVGSGFEDVVYLAFGAKQGEHGSLTLDGVVYPLRSITPAKAIAAGISFIPADRQTDGSVGSLPAVDNMSLHILNQYFNGIVLDRRRMARDAQGLMTQFDVRPPDASMNYSLFSGGNQQKALLAKWLQGTPRLLLLHEPTQGVDVGAREGIFELIREGTAEQTCALCASSDYEQLATICDRVLIFGDGRVTSELVGDEITKERITEQCYAGSRPVASRYAKPTGEERAPHGT